jgi:hypothetical protein
LAVSEQQATRIAGVAAAASLALTGLACGSSINTQSTVDNSPGPRYPSPPIGDRAAFTTAYDACNDGITAEEMCVCIAAKLSERNDAASLDYPALLDYNNPDPPGFLIDITGYCSAR